MQSQYEEIEPDFQRIMLEWELSDADFRADYAIRAEQNAMDALSVMAEFFRSGEIEKRAAAERFAELVETWIVRTVWGEKYNRTSTLGHESHFSDSCMCQNND